MSSVPKIENFPKKFDENLLANQSDHLFISKNIVEWLGFSKRQTADLLASCNEDSSNPDSGFLSDARSDMQKFKKIFDLCRGEFEKCHGHLDYLIIKCEADSIPLNFSIQKLFTIMQKTEEHLDLVRNRFVTVKSSIRQFGGHWISSHSSSMSSISSTKDRVTFTQEVEQLIDASEEFNKQLLAITSLITKSKADWVISHL